MPSLRTNRSSGEVISASDLNALATAINTVLSGSEFSDAAAARVGAMVAAAGGTYNATTKQITLPGAAIDDSTASSTKTYSSNKIVSLVNNLLTSNEFGKAARDQAGGMIAAAGGTYNATAGTITLPSGGGAGTIADGSVTIAKLASGIYPTGTAAARQMPYRNDANSLQWTAANAVVAEALGWKVVDTFAGADATGATSSKAAVDAAHTACPVGGTIYFGPGTWDWTGDVQITRQGVNVTGPSAVVRGQLKFGDGTSRKAYTPERPDMGGSLHHLTMSRPLNKTITGQTVKGYADGSYFVKLDLVRDLQIYQCHFYGAAYPIYKAPNATAQDHDLSMINVSHCDFDECDIAFYAPNDPAEPWAIFADSNFTDNMINKSYVSMYDAAGQDGGFVEGNTHFMLNYGSTGNPRWQEKRQNIRIGYGGGCAWVHVVDNNLFEAGSEGILLDFCRNVKVMGNLVAWPGQRVPSDAIRIMSNSGGTHPAGTYATVVVTGNIGEFYSKSLVSVEGDIAALTLGQNTPLYTTATSGTAAGRYVGITETTAAQRKATLDALPHSRYNLGGVTNLPAARTSISDGVLTNVDAAGALLYNDVLPGAHPLMTAVKSYAPYAGHSGGYVASLAFTAATAGSVIQLRGIADNFSTYSGFIVVTARTTAASNKESSYVLHVAKTAAGGLLLNVISALGYTTGAAADDPSFEWSLESNGLRAKPLGLTAGTFLFSPLSTGNLTVG